MFIHVCNIFMVDVHNIIYTELIQFSLNIYFASTVKQVLATQINQSCVRFLEQDCLIVSVIRGYMVVTLCRGLNPRHMG